MLNQLIPWMNCVRTRALSAFSCMVLMLVAAGCGQTPSPTHVATVQVDAAFTSYVSRFEAASAEYGRTTQITDVIVQFGQINEPGENGARGVCEVVTGQTPVVTIAASAWATSNEAEREELIFHELGHCILGLKHVRGINEDGIPKSLMNPSEIDGAIYTQNRDFYLKGIFAAN